MMKKLLTWIAIGCLLLGLSGCGAAPMASKYTSPLSEDAGTDDDVSINDAENHSMTMQAIALPSTTQTVTADDGTVLFSLSVPQAQVILGNPESEQKITEDLQARIAPILTDATHIEDQAQSDYPEIEYWSEYLINVSYTPTRLDQAVMSLFGNTFTYCGGPHPSLTTDSVTYDLQTGDVLYLDDILTPECTSDTLYQLILQSLYDREDDLYYDYADALGDRFTGELHSIQDWYFSRNGLCFHFAPYDIAPYSSGTIIATLPYATLNGVLKEDYFPTEPPVSTGSMYAEMDIEKDNVRFHFVADVTLENADTEVLLYPDATVTNIRIESGTIYDNNQYIAGATVFAASTMNVGDAIRLNGDLMNCDTVLRLIYRSDDQEYSSFITYNPAENAISLSNAG